MLQSAYATVLQCLIDIKLRVNRHAFVLQRCSDDGISDARRLLDVVRNVYTTHYTILHMARTQQAYTSRKSKFRTHTRSARAPTISRS